MQNIELTQTDQSITLKNGCIDQLHLQNVMVKNLAFVDVNLSGARISDANLSDLEIEGAQLGGAYIHNIGLPPLGHPFYVEGARQRPLRFEDCALNESTFTNCDLSGVSFLDCDLSGASINGVPVAELWKAYADKRGG